LERRRRRIVALDALVEPAGAIHNAIRPCTLDKPIANGPGTIRVDHTVWRVTGADCGAGTRVRVTRTEGATLYVDPD
jgi:hypothetical protein